MKFKIDGKDVPFVEPENIRLRELAEAEKALQISMSDGSAGAMAVSMFVAIRRSGDDRSAAVLADYVLNADLSVIDMGEDDAVPPGSADEGENLVSLPTGGTQDSARSA